MILKTLDWIALLLLILGGINIGIVGLFDYDPLIDFLSGDVIYIAHLLFFLIGIAGLYAIFRFRYLLRLLQPTE